MQRAPSFGSGGAHHHHASGGGGSGLLASPPRPRATVPPTLQPMPMRATSQHQHPQTPRVKKEHQPHHHEAHHHHAPPARGSSGAAATGATTPRVKLQPGLTHSASAASGPVRRTLLGDAPPPLQYAHADEYAMQWDITTGVGHSYASASSLPDPALQGLGLTGPGPAGRASMVCPVRGCGARYVQRKSLHNHMFTVHRGAKATRELAATITARKRASLVAASAAAGAAPKRSPRKKQRVQPPPATASTFAAAAAASNDHFELSQSTASTASDEDEFDADIEAAVASLLSDANSDNSDDSDGGPRPVAVPVRLATDFRAAAAQASSKATQSPAKSKSRPSSTSAAADSNSSLPERFDVYPPSTRTFPSYGIAAAFPPQARDGMHPLLQLLTKLFASYFSTPVVHRGDEFTVDEIFVHFLLSRYDSHSGLDRLAYQALLTRSLWIRGGLERWARNWKRVTQDAASAAEESPVLSRYYRGTRPTRAELATAAVFAGVPVPEEPEDESDEETWWRNFTLSRRYRPRLLLSRISSFLDVTFEHGEGKSVHPSEQALKAKVVHDMKRWSSTLPKAPTMPTHRPPQRESSLPSNVQFSPTKPRRDPEQRERYSAPSPAAAAAAAASTPSTPCPTTAAAAAAAPAASPSSAALLSWSKASLEQLNSLLLSNDGRVDRNLTLRQIADTLGKSVESVRFQVAQIRKLKEIEEARANGRVEQEKLEQLAERAMQRAAARGGAKVAKRIALPAAAAAAIAAAAQPPHNLLHSGDVSMLDSSLVPSIGNRGRKRKAKGAAAAAPLIIRGLAPPPASRPTPQAAQPAAASARRAVAPAAAAADSDDDSTDAAAAAAAIAPPAKRQRMTKKKKAALEAAAAAAASAAASSVPPPPHHAHPHHAYGMMYGAYGGYPSYPPMPPMPPVPPMPPHGAVSSSSAQAAHAHHTYSGYPMPYPPPGWGHPAHAHGPPGYPPPPPVGADGRPMQWSWMLVPVPVPPAPPQARADEDND